MSAEIYRHAKRNPLQQKTPDSVQGFSRLRSFIIKVILYDTIKTIHDLVYHALNLKQRRSCAMKSR